MMGYVILFPDSYVIMQIGNLVSGEWGLSINSRFYSTLGPVINLLSSYTLLGYGLGGTTIHFSEIVPAFAQAPIAAVTWEQMPNLLTLIGRLLSETGFVGLSLFAMMIFVSLQELRSMCWEPTTESRIILLKVSRIALFAILVGITIAHGSFAVPYLWFWLAFIDSRYIQERQGETHA